MGRSKSKKQDKLSIDSVEPTSMSNTKGKRPLIDEDVEEKLIDLDTKISNGVPKAKRAKLIAKSELVEDEAEEDSSVSDDEEVDLSEEEVDESDDSKDEDDEDEEDDSGSEEDDETETASPIKQSANPKSPKASGELAPPRKSDISTTKRETKNFIVIANPPSDKSKLKSCLSKYKIDASSARTVTVPLAVIETDEVKAQQLSASHVSIDGDPLHILHLRGTPGPIESLLNGNATATLLITGLPKDLTLESLSAQLPSTCNPVSSKLLSQGPKNKFSNAAILSFKSKNDSIIALEKILAMRFGKSKLRVVFAKDQRADTPQTQELRNKTSTLMALQLPAGTTDSQMKSVFKNATKCELVSRTGDIICFMEFADPSAASAAFDEHNSQKFGQSKLALRFVPTRSKATDACLFVSNFAPGTEPNKVEGLFPGAISSDLSKGNIVVRFPSIEIRRRAVSHPKTLAGRKLALNCPGGLNGTIAVVNNIPFDATKEQLMETISGLSSVELHKRPDGKSQGNATVTFKSTQLYQKAVSQSLSMAGRKLSFFLKRVPCDEIANEKSDAPVSQKKIRQDTKSAMKPNPKQVGSSSEESEDDDEDEDNEEDDVESESANESDAAMDDEDVDDDDEEGDDDDEDDAASEDDEESGDDQDEEDADSDVEMEPVSQPKKDSRGRGKPFSPGQRGGSFKPQRGSFGDRGGEGFRGRGSFRGRGDGFRGRGDGFRGRGDGFRGRGRGDSFGGRGRGRGFRGNGSRGRSPGGFRGGRGGSR